MPTALRRHVPMLLVCLLGPAARAQAPLASDASEALHALWLQSAVSRSASPKPIEGVALSVGLLSVSRDSASPWMPLVRGAGQGSTTLGQGLMVGGSWVREGWEVSAEGTVLRDFDDRLTRGRLSGFSVVKRTEGGWRWGVEKRPLQWGYGLFGGYLLGDSHDPVPRLLLESPSADLNLFGVPLGTWGFETFLGRLEWNRQIPAWVSTPRTTQQALESAGNLRRPNLSGLRLRAAFGPHVDMNFGLVSEWGGVDASGRDIMRGLPLWNYPLAYLGAENLLVAEASGDAENPDPTKRFATNKDYHALSNALANVEVRVRLPETAARWFGAKGLALYLSRGATSVNWQWKDFLRRPFSAWSHDLRFLGRKFRNAELSGSDPDSVWGWAYAQGTPALVHINDTVGAQWVFENWDFGIELSDLHNQPYPASTYRVYGHWRNLSGHSRYGDSLGQPLGGEVFHQGLSAGFKVGSGGRIRLQFLDAIRYYRDSPETTPAYVPGEDDHFIHAQVDARWTLSSGRIGGSLAFERHRADLFIPGNRKSNWILSFGYALPILKPARSGTE